MKIFPLLDENGRLFPPIQQASALAQYSRSPKSATQLIQETSESKAESFQKKWIVDFGHSSVAELATIPCCFEGVSIVASKVLESMPRPGCAEKSTRMQKFKRDQMCWPSEKIRELGTDLVDRAFDLYEKILPWALEAKPYTEQRALDVSGHKRAALDIAAHCLPAGVKTNLALVAYPRDLSKLISLLTGSYNPEFRKIGEELRTALEGLGGPLIRHSEPEPWLQHFVTQTTPRTPRFTIADRRDIGTGRHTPHVVLIKTNPWYTDSDLLEAASDMYETDETEFSRLMSERPAKQEVPDVFRLLRVRYEIFMDYRSWRDLQRHRRLLQLVEPLGTDNGWILPEGMEQCPYKDEFVSLMEQVEDLDSLKDVDPVLIQYVIPMAFFHRSVLDMDLQQLYYMTELRTQPQGHTAYRRIAWAMADMARKLYPKAMSWCRAINPDK